MKKIIFLLTFFLAYSYSYAVEVAEKDIKVGIILNTAAFSVGNNKEFLISDAKGKKYKLTKGTLNVFYKNNRLIIESLELALPVVINSKNGIIYANKKPYRGYLIIDKNGKNLNIINVLSVEDYLKGVLPKEANAGWNIEALKAQAVISRTYILSNLKKHSKEGFNLCATTHCQVYGGAESEAKSCNKAIEETEGEVLTYDGKLAQTVFHANCGGYTEDPKYVWNWSHGTPDYLKGVKCGYCANAPHSNWEQSLEESFIRKKLIAAGYNVGKIKSIKPKGKTSAGSYKEVEITSSKGKIDVHSYKFRLAVDAWKVKSTTFDSIKKSGDSFVFKGKGWGHKVGLCQWGAKGMADSGKNYKQILKHFYPKTKLEKIKYK